MTTATAEPTASQDTEKRPYRSYKELNVWKRAMDLVVLVYEETAKFPADQEILADQMREHAVSIPTLIASGRNRRSHMDNKYSLSAAHDNGTELETRLELAKRLPGFGGTNFEKVEQPLTEVLKMLGGMIKKLNQRINTDYDRELGIEVSDEE